MSECLNVSQMKKLQAVLFKNLVENKIQRTDIKNEEYLKLFLDAKMIEGCSKRTLQYYRITITKLLDKVSTPIRKLSTEEIRQYLVEYQTINNCSKVTIDNVRRNLSSFFSWLEEEDYILKSPMIGHSQIDTTMQYAIVNQYNVKISHQRFIV